MKKLVFIFIFSLLFLNPNEVFANICVYGEETGSNVVDSSTNFIKISFDNGSWKMKLEHRDEDYYESLSGNFDKVFKDDYIKMDSGYRESLKKFASCPKYVYIDYDWSNSVCFTSKGESDTKCDTKDKKLTLDRCNVVASPYNKDGYIQFELKDFCYNTTIKADIMEDINSAASQAAENWLSAPLEYDENYETTIKAAVSAAFITSFDNYTKGMADIDKDVLKQQFTNSDFSELIDPIIDSDKEKLNQVKEDLEKIATNAEGSADESHVNRAENYADNIGNITTTGIIYDMDDVVNIFENIGGFIINEFTDCESLLGNPEVEYSPAWYLTIIFQVLKYICLGILIALSIVEFVSAVASHDNEILKKAVNKTIKRLVICVIIWILPTFIKLFLSYIDNIPNDLCIK